MSHMGSPQTLSESDRRIVAAWAAACAERVLALFEAQAPGDRRPRDAIARTRAFARGELAVADEIRRRFVGGGAARDVRAPAAAAAARAAGQATAVAHMGAHALGAAAYAAKARWSSRAPDLPVAVQPIAHDGGSGRRSQAKAWDAAGTACPVEADPEPRDSAE
jgi:hypothetical protein